MWVMLSMGVSLTIAVGNVDEVTVVLLLVSIGMRLSFLVLFLVSMERRSH